MVLSQGSEQQGVGLRRHRRRGRHKRFMTGTVLADPFIIFYVVIKPLFCWSFQHIQDMCLLVSYKAIIIIGSIVVKISAIENTQDFLDTWDFRFNLVYHFWLHFLWLYVLLCALSRANSSCLNQLACSPLKMFTNFIIDIYNRFLTSGILDCNIFV